VDVKVAADAEAKLAFAAQRLAKTGQPFYLAVGLRKTHLSWRFPAPWLQVQTLTHTHTHTHAHTHTHTHTAALSNKGREEEDEEAEAEKRGALL